MDVFVHSFRNAAIIYKQMYLIILYLDCNFLCCSPQASPGVLHNEQTY